MDKIRDEYPRLEDFVSLQLDVMMGQTDMPQEHLDDPEMAAKAWDYANAKSTEPKF